MNYSSNIEIDGVEFDVLWSNNNETPNRFEDTFDVVNNTLEFDWCWRFASTEWVEINVKILAEDESMESNSFSIRIVRPYGAN